MVARRLGKPFMPWQQHVADVVLEVDPDTGELVYDEWDLTVPRQSGKSTLVLAKAVHRCSATNFFGPRQNLVYTAQTRIKAREKWEEDYADELTSSRTWRNKVKVHKGNGHEHIRFPNRSRWGIDSNTEKAGHGGTVDEAYIDEAFAQVDNRLENAFGPAMITRLNRQLGVISTAGWLDASPYLWAKVERGRALVEAGTTRGTAYFEWSALETADPGDPATWWSCMPALGFTITEAAIAREWEKALEEGKANDFRRAYLNQWVAKDTPDEALVDATVWASLEHMPDQRPDPVAFALSTAPTRRWSYIAVAGDRPDGNQQLQIAHAQKGTSWAVAELDRMNKEWGPVAVAIAADDPAMSLVPELELRGLEITVVSRTELARACGAFVDTVGQDLDHSTIRYDGAKAQLLSVALGAAGTRPLGGDLWIWRGPKDGTDIAPLKAATVALYALATAPRNSGIVRW